MHHLAHVASQTDGFAAQAMGRVAPPAQVATAQVSDSGRFRESLQASVGATTPITTPRIAKVADEAQRPRDAVRDNVPPVPEKDVPARKNVSRESKPQEPEASPSTAPAAAKKTAHKEDEESTDADRQQPGATQAGVPEPTPASAIVPVPQLKADSPIEVAAESALTPQLAAIKTGQSGTAGQVAGKSAKYEDKRADDASSGADVPVRSTTVTYSIGQPQGVQQHVEQAVPAALGVAVTHHVHADATAASIAAPAKASAVSATSLSATADTTAQASDMKTLVAAPNVLEVGIASGSHGWLRVRAELDGSGEVAASVLAGSQGVADGLHKEMPAISAYLAGERVQVSSLAVHVSDKSAAAQDATTNSGSGTAGGSSQGRQNGSAERSTAAAPVGSLPERNDGRFAPGGISTPAAIFAGGTGNWLSVRV